MGNSELSTTSISNLVQLGNTCHIGSDLMLFDDFTELQLPDGVCRVSDIVVALCLESVSRYTANTVEYTVEPNDVIIIPDGQAMGRYVVGPGARGIALMMSPDFYQEIVKDIHELSSLIVFSRSHPVFRIRPCETRNMVTYYNLIKEKINDTGNAYRRDVVGHLISAMICELNNAIRHIRLGDDGKQTRAEEIFAEFIRLVEQNYMRERRVAWYGEQMCITPKYLSEMVKAVSRRTPNEWIDNYVVMELRSLLKNTTKTVKEIAADMNFPNQSFLGKYFKEHVGLSPVSYRKS